MDSLLQVGDEDGKAKTALLKMRVQFMLQVPQDDIKSLRQVSSFSSEALDDAHPISEEPVKWRRSKVFELWDSMTAKLAGDANIPFLLLHLPQIVLNTRNLLEGNTSALLAVPWLGMLTGLLGNLCLASYFIKKRETEATVVQTLGVISIYVVMLQLAMVKVMPLPQFIVTSVVVASSHYKFYAIFQFAPPVNLELLGRLHDNSRGLHPYTTLASDLEEFLGEFRYKGKVKDIELKGHTDSVDQLCWDPKHADLIATSSGDKTVRLWDARSGKCSQQAKLSGENINITYKPDGVYIAVGNRDDELTILDVRKFKPMHKRKFNYEVFYYLDELDDSLSYALGAGPLFDVSEDSDYVRTLLGKSLSLVFPLKFYDNCSKSLAIFIKLRVVTR
ncbi:hypothetical protein ACS0TY_034284 [Phlomoides rotata]